MATYRQHIDAAWSDIAAVAHALAKVPGTETALMAAAFVDALRVLAGARALVIANQMTDEQVK